MLTLGPLSGIITIASLHCPPWPRVRPLASPERALPIPPRQVPKTELHSPYPGASLRSTALLLCPSTTLQITKGHRVTRWSSLLHILSCGSQAHLVSFLGTELNTSGSAACTQWHTLCTAQREWAPFTLVCRRAPLRLCRAPPGRLYVVVLIRVAYLLSTEQITRPICSLVWSLSAVPPPRPDILLIPT